MRELIIVGGSFFLLGGIAGWVFGYAVGFAASTEAAKLRALEDPNREI